jgi:hypothetical protein
VFVIKVFAGTSPIMLAHSGRTKFNAKSTSEKAAQQLKIGLFKIEFMLKLACSIVFVFNYNIKRR